MSLPAQLEGLAEVKGALIADPGGRLVSAEPPGPDATGRAAAVAVAAAGFATVGSRARLGALTGLWVKGPASSTVTAVRADALLCVTVDPATTSLQVERALERWAAAGATRAGAATPAPAPTPSPPPARRPTPPQPVQAVQAVPGGAVRTRPPPAPVPTFVPGAKPAIDPWAALRRALGRGQLNEASTHQRQLLPAADASRPGAEPVEPEICDRAVRTLLEGIGSALAGDGLGAGRALEPLAAASQPNLSFRWLALLWSARAALRSGAIPAARAHVQEALTLARQLDIEARAMSQWVAADVLAQDGDPTRALTWLSEARGRFAKGADPWGVGQTWLSEARVLTAVKRDAEAAAAARQAAALLPDSEEPQVTLARLAVMRDDLPAAERALQALRTQSAERLRGLVAAVRSGILARADAVEFLREVEAPPSERALRSLERISNASPRFLPAREALAWVLLRLGRYDEAGAVFRGLQSQALSPGERASVMLGLGCISNAQGPGGAKAATVRSVVSAGAALPGQAAAADDLPPLPPLSSSAMLSRAPPGSAGGAVFSGQLSSFALPDLLEFLRSGKRSGLLVCSSASGMGALRFFDGWVTAAASPTTPGIGEVLVLSRKVAPDALRKVTAALGPEPADAQVAERLVSDGHADPATVRAGFERQIRLAIRELMLWTDGEFTFNREAEAPLEAPGLAVALDPQGLLLNFFKDMDEASRDAASP